MRTFLGRVKKTPAALAAALMMSAIGCASDNHPNNATEAAPSPVVTDRFSQHLAKMNALLPTERLAAGRISPLSVNDFRQAVYGDALPAEIAKANAYRQKHSEISFASDYSPENLSRRAPVYVFNGIGPWMGAVASENDIILFPAFADNAAAPFLYMHCAERLGTLPVTQAELVKIDTRQGHPLNKTLRDLANPESSARLIEAFATSFKRFCFAMGVSTDSPEDCVWAYKQLGFDIDQNAVTEVFKDRGIMIFDNAFDVPAIADTQLKEIYRHYDNLQDLRAIINGTPTGVPLRQSHPQLYKKIMDGLIFRTPGLVQASPAVEPTLGMA